MGFVEVRHILDGNVFSYEVVHSLKIQKKLGMILKLDLSSAFDILSLKYMENFLFIFWFLGGLDEMNHLPYFQCFLNYID